MKLLQLLEAIEKGEIKSVNELKKVINVKHQSSLYHHLNLAIESGLLKSRFPYEVTQKGKQHLKQKPNV